MLAAPFWRRADAAEMKGLVPVRPLIHKSADPPPEPEKPKASKSSEAAKTFKLAFAIVGLLIGGLLIAWQTGLLFDSGPPPAPERPALPATPPHSGNQVMP